MKNVITIHIILCGLLSNIIIASEGNTNSLGAIITTGDTFNMIKYEIANVTHIATMSQSSDSPHNSSPMDIPTKPKRSFSSGVSPKSRQVLSPRNSSESSTQSLSYGSISEYMAMAKSGNLTSSNQDNIKK